MTTKKKRNLDAIMGQGPMLVEFYRNNPCIAAYELLGVDLAPIQRIIFEDMWFKSYVIAIVGRGGGKTYLQGVLAALSSMLYPGYRVGLVGPSFRQSKMMFSEVEKLYGQSSILREATEKRPIRGSDTCYLEFKSIGGHTNSRIEAIPLGNDGAKVRGSRFYLICIDELAQVPDKILDMVLRPMGATKLAPMENVRRIEQQKELIEAGLATDDDFEEDTVNKMIMTSSGFYKFNHMYRRMKSYWSKMEEGDPKYSVFQIPYTLLPDGFSDMDNISEAQRVMSNHEFRMEYMAEMISDSEGFFQASLLESCTLGSNFSLKFRGDKNKQYIVGVDPNQGGDASCGVIVIEIDNPNKIVNVIELKKLKTQDLTKAIQELCHQYNVIRIYMDKGGGGKAVCDLLEEGYNSQEPIIDRTNEDHRHMKGRHILEMINFTTAWISDANFSTLSLFEDQKLLFPVIKTSSSEDKAIAIRIDKESMQYENVLTLKKQLLNIIVTQTSSGALHFDTPKKGQNKDLYSALILAGYGVKLYEKEMEEDDEPVLYSSSGMVRAHSGSQTSWNPLTQAGPVILVAQKGIEHAVLQKRIK